MTARLHGATRPLVETSIFRMTITQTKLGKKVMMNPGSKIARPRIATMRLWMVMAGMTNNDRVLSLLQNESIQAAWQDGSW